jgi:hypothetical protein
MVRVPDLAGFNTPNFASLTTPNTVSLQTPGTAILTSLANPYGIYSNPYLNTEPALGATLQGTGDLMTAQGKWSLDVQRANALEEKYRQVRMETVRKQGEEDRFEKDNTPSAEDERRRALEQQLSRSLNDPPRGDIYSGQALNVLLDAASKFDPTGGQAPAGGQSATSIDRGLLGRLNLTKGKGHAGIFRNQGRLDWPQELMASTYLDERKLLDGSIPVALRETAHRTLDPRTLDDLNRWTQALRQKLKSRVAEIAPASFMEAGRFLTHLEEGLRLLSQPQAGEQLAANLGDKDMSIGQVVPYMRDNALRFAPAMSGDEPAYVAMHRALVGYHIGGRP